MHISSTEEQEELGKIWLQHTKPSCLSTAKSFRATLFPPTRNVEGDLCVKGHTLLECSGVVSQWQAVWPVPAVSTSEPNHRTWGTDRPALSKDAGQDDLQKSLPISTVQWKPNWTSLLWQSRHHLSGFHPTQSTAPCQKQTGQHGLQYSLSTLLVCYVCFPAGGFRGPQLWH